MFLNNFLRNFFGKFYKSFILKQALSSKNSNFCKSIEKANDLIDKKIETLITESAKCLNFQNESQTRLTLPENRNVNLLDSEVQSDLEIIFESIEQQPNDIQIEPSTSNKPIRKRGRKKGHSYPIITFNKNDLISRRLRIRQPYFSVIKHKQIGLGRKLGVKKFPCEKCKRNFCSKSSVKDHLNICKGLNFSLTTSQNLKP